MIQMPQLVGLLNAFGGLASAVEAIGLFVSETADEKWYYKTESVSGAYQAKLKKEDGSWSEGKRYVDISNRAERVPCSEP